MPMKHSAVILPVAPNLASPNDLVFWNCSPYLPPERPKGRLWHVRIAGLAGIDHPAPACPLPHFLAITRELASSCILQHLLAD